MFNMQCTDDEYSNTYYKTQWHDYNCTYNIYAIKIGKIYSQYLSQTQIKNISHSISKQLLFLPDKMYHASTTAEGRIRKQLYHKYYNNFHHTSTSQCQSKHDSESVHEIDFFKFIQTDAKYTNNPNATQINFYNLLPMNDSQLIGDYMNDYYYIPTLYSYVLSVNKNGNISSLELRFGAIINKLQHDETKHVMLNNNKRYILWAGEFFYIYDYKYRKYVLIVDNASGHWKPNQNQIPVYIKKLLLQTLFPKYIFYKNEYGSYSPLIIVGYQQFPWVTIKKRLFDVIHEINHLYHDRHKNKREFLHDLRKEIEKRSGKKIQKAGHGKK